MSRKRKPIPPAHEVKIDENGVASYRGLVLPLDPYSRYAQAAEIILTPAIRAQLDNIAEGKLDDCNLTRLPYTGRENDFTQGLYNPEIKFSDPRK